MATPLPEEVLGFDSTYPTADQEKKYLDEHSPHPRPASSPAAAKMPSTRRLLITLLACCLLTFGLASAFSPAPWGREAREVGHEESPVAQEEPLGGGAEDSGFGRLLNAVSQESLHDLLHRYFPKTYKHGVYASDHSALEAVHRVNAPLASSIIHMAKRQEGEPSNTTVTTPPPPPTSSTTAPPPPPPTSSTTNPPPPPPPTSSSTTGPPPPTSTTSNPPSSSTPSSSRPTSSGTFTTTPIPSSRLPPTLSSSSSTRSSSTRPASSSQAGPTMTTSKSSSRPLKPVTSTYTSVINGSPTVVTATTYVPAEGDSGTSTKPNGSLQTDAAAAGNRDVMFGAAVAILGGALLM